MYDDSDMEDDEDHVTDIEPVFVVVDSEDNDGAEDDEVDLFYDSEETDPNVVTHDLSTAAMDLRRDAGTGRYWYLKVDAS